MLPGLRVFALPLKRSFRGVTVREGLLFEGPNGWAEFAPFKDHSDVHAGRWLTAAIEQAYGEWPTLARTSIPVNAIIPFADPATTTALVEEAITAGMTTIKTKVGAEDFEEDVARVAAIRAALDDAGIDGAIRIDTNQQWSLEQAIDRLAVLDAIANGLEYAEQPVAGSDDLAALRRAVDVPIAVDEGLRLAVDPQAAAREIGMTADVVVLKAIPLGGVHAALRIADQLNVPVVVSGSLDTSVGLASGLHLAGALHELPFACGLATGALFAHDVVTRPSHVVHGELPVRRTVPEEVDPLGMVTTSMTEEWHARLARAWEYADRELLT